MTGTLRQRIEAIRRYLPPVPGVFAELVQLLHNDNVDTRVLSRVIARDPAMSINVLRIANSAFYGLPNKVKTVEHAVTMLGLKEITGLCMACETGRIFKPRPGEKHVNLHAFWLHSVATAVFSRLFSNQFRVEPQDQAYLAGLLHDIGQLILDRFLHAEYEQVVKLTYDENIPLVDAEIRVLGESHGTISGWLMDKWHLPPLLSEIGSCHHAVGAASAENRLIVAVVSLADQAARLKGFGFGGDETGVILEETEAFKVIQQWQPELRELDIARFIMDLDRADFDITSIEEMMDAT
ncbi:MAG TPA: HDOD domain-containing protein [Syntrophorhabdales bacterium]|nr:HDOD domain-containing protein [Syntrophorhabdales bacterium]